MILLLARAALALDAHGAAAVPTTGADPAEALLVPEVGAPATSAGVIAEAVSTPAIGWAEDGVNAPLPLLDDLVGLTVAGGYGFGRFGIDASLPLWVHYAGTDGAATGAFPGDLRVGVPVALWRGTDGLGLGVRLEGVAGTGDTEALLGGGWGGGLTAVVGRRGEGFGWSFDAGVAGSTDATLGNVDRSWVVPLGAQAGWNRGWFGAGLEAWLSPSLTATSSPWSSAPGELLARVGVRTHAGLSLTLAGGHAITPGVGGSGGRILLRAGWSRPVAAPVAVPVAHATGPYDLLIDARDPDGRPLDATVTVTGAGAPGPIQLGADGEGQVPLAPGDWVVSVAAPGHETQRRDVHLDTERWRPAALDAVLAPAGNGVAALTVRLVDASGAPVEGARLAIDGVTRGTTSTGGSLTVEDVAAGTRSVSIDAEGFLGVAPLAVDLGTADIARTVVLLRPTGSVKVIARAGDLPAADAEVRLLGPADIAPTRLGADGEALFQLVPGHWLVVVSAPSLGVQQREVDVSPGGVGLVEVDVRLTPAEGDGALGVRVVDTAGRPVDGAEVRLDGAALGKTSTAGTLEVEGLRPGPRVLDVGGPRLVPSAPRTVVVGGAQDVDVVLAWRPGSVHVRARGPSGEPVDGQLRFVGPTAVPPAHLGADGEGFYELARGDWQVALSAPELGLQTRAVHIEPDDTALINVDASLLHAAGTATLLLSVAGPPDAPVDGAHVRVDDLDVGGLAGASLRLEGLSPGRHRVAVGGAAFADWTEDTTLHAGDNPVAVTLAWAKAAVRVHARGPDGVVTDALARFFGPALVAPAPLGATGEHVFELERRDGWQLVGSSPRWGLAQRAVTLAPPTADAPTPLADVDLAFTPPPAGRAGLAIEVVDPDGAPVSGATLTLGGVVTPAPLGYVLVPDHAIGPLALHATAPGYLARDEALVLVEGGQTRRLRLEWLPRVVRVHVADTEGHPVAAQVRFAGPRAVAPGATGADGTVQATVRPGRWQVLVSATELGARSVEVSVPAGVDPIDVDVRLEASHVTMTSTELRITEQVHFATDEATIAPDSYRILEEVAAALALDPGITAVEIQGHTDTVGDPLYNLDLSQRRAEAVRTWLVAHGVAPGRLVAKGYGVTVPIAPNTTEAGRRANRRVQFQIVGRG